ncbi:MAG: hypothetical protein JXQ93_08655 [Flavobacteriaceae bacterium]
MNNKFIKFLIILNGVMLPILLGFGIYQLAKEFFPKQIQQQERGLIVGDDLEENKKDSIAWQGLEYDFPEEIYNSTGFLIKVGVKDYTKGKSTLNLYSKYAGDGYYYGYLSLVNVVFLDKNYQVMGSLLDKKASITEVSPQRKRNKNDTDTDITVKYIGYLIAFKDTNNDGKLNSLDHHDLYLSDLRGGNFKKVSNNIDIQSFNYIQSNSQIFIRYTNRENIREEHKKTRFAIYDIQSSKFLNLSSIDLELDKLEKIIIN